MLQNKAANILTDSELNALTAEPIIRTIRAVTSVVKFQTRFAIAKYSGPLFCDNICYADLSDCFYCWLKPMFQTAYLNCLEMIATPKQEELVTAKYRHSAKGTRNHSFLMACPVQLPTWCNNRLAKFR